MLLNEKEIHLRAAAFADDAEKRAEHRGIVKWLDEVISGVLPDRYSETSREALGVKDDEMDGVPHYEDGGSEYMEGDGLSEGDA